MVVAVESSATLVTIVWGSAHSTNSTAEARRVPPTGNYRHDDFFPLFLLSVSHKPDTAQLSYL